jgi:hypothetical protein
LKSSEQPFVIKYCKNIMYREKVLKQCKGQKMYHDYQITIVTLIRNNQQYLRGCLESVFRQTNNNWNMIIINDASDEPINIKDHINEKYIDNLDKLKIY